MKKDDREYGRPDIVYRDTKTNIEALTGLAEGSIAYATDTDEFGSYDGAAWTWGQGGGAGGHVIQDEGVPLAARANLNFEGAGVTVTDDAGNDASVVTIPGSGTIADHDHSGDAGDGGQFDAANLESGAADDGQVLTADGAGGAAWEDVPGGSGGTVLRSIWFPDAPAASPDAMDDEFDDGALDTGLWTEYDPGSEMTYVEDDRGLVLTHTAGGDYFRLAGLYQTLAAGDQSLYTKVALNWQKGVQWSSAGLCLWEDATDQTKKARIWGFWHDSTNVYYISDTYSAYNADPSHETFDSFGIPRHTELYFRMRIVGSNVYEDYSIDGYAWVPLFASGAAPSIGFTPAHAGIFANTKTSGSIARPRFSFFRRKSTTNIYDILEGQAIALMAP